MCNYLSDRMTETTQADKTVGFNFQVVLKLAEVFTFKSTDAESHFISLSKLNYIMTISVKKLMNIGQESNESTQY